MPAPTQLASLASHQSWANTVDRTARTRPARSASPASVDYFLARLPEQFVAATPEQRRAAAESAQKAYFARLALASAKARRRGGPDADA